MEFSLSDGIKEWVDRNKEGIAYRSVDRVEMAKYVKELCKEHIDQLKGLTGQAADPQLLRDCEFSAETVLCYHALYYAFLKSMSLREYNYWNTQLNETITEYSPIFKTLEKARAGVGSSSSDGELGHALNSISESFKDSGIDGVAANHDYPHVQLLYNHGKYFTWLPITVELKKLELGESAADANVGPTEALGHDPNYTPEGFIYTTWEESNAVKIIEGAHANLGTLGVPIAQPLTTESQENTTNDGGSNVPDQITIIDMPTNNDDINATPAEPERVGNYLMTSETNVLLGISAPFVALTNNISDSDSPHAMTLLVIAAALGVLFIVLGCILRGKRPTWSIRMTNAAIIINATGIIFSMLLHVGLVMALIGGSLAFFIIAAAMLLV
ncbi:hypothetical protein ABFS83_12G073300 [Erythranthe nasuta]